MRSKLRFLYIILIGDNRNHDKTKTKRTKAGQTSTTSKEWSGQDTQQEPKTAMCKLKMTWNIKNKLQYFQRSQFSLKFD